MSSDRDLNNLPFESPGLPGAKRVDSLDIIQFPISLTKQERKRAYRRKRFACLKSPKFKCGPPTVESRSITLPSSGFTDCEYPSSDSEVIATCTTFSSSLRSDS